MVSSCRWMVDLPPSAGCREQARSRIVVVVLAIIIDQVAARQLSFSAGQRTQSRGATADPQLQGDARILELPRK